MVSHYLIINYVMTEELYMFGYTIGIAAHIMPIVNFSQEETAAALLQYI